MKMKNEHTLVAGFAIIGIAVMFVMTATQGKYWGNEEIDHYIIKITEGEEESYLNSETPTAMIISKFATSPFLSRNCLQRGTCDTKETCTVVDEGYVISKGKKVAKASVMECTTSEEKIERDADDSIAYTTQGKNR